MLVSPGTLNTVTEILLGTCSDGNGGGGHYGGSYCIDDDDGSVCPLYIYHLTSGLFRNHSASAQDFITRTASALPTDTMIII